MHMPDYGAVVLDHDGDEAPGRALLRPDMISRQNAVNSYGLGRRVYVEKKTASRSLGTPLRNEKPPQS